MKILFGFEESQACTIAARKQGHEAYSCDLVDCSGGHPEWHYKGDIFEVLAMGVWDGAVLFPPCTDLARSGSKHFAGKRESGRQKASVELFLNAIAASQHIPRLAVENPVGIMGTEYITAHFPELLPLAHSLDFPRPPDQIIQPYWFGDPFTKETCLWLRGLRRLKPTNLVDKGDRHITKSGKSLPVWYNLPPGPDRARLRSKTFPGIANAIATQWFTDADPIHQPPSLFNQP